ncbi:conserved hypothetical protein [Bradyrhizobium oligotrophicum S58]|uniref:High light inducible protein n=1 Tax=Bradyrhizobium oligotrophicum S58 TaxID=1245469 RepID=M4ZH99_9BRAD|nr:DUF3326 domain-containing protein [Bradyrhizobium oligotrophicum]BAM93203.1 conserved hypothetical protein [Bradyrhizobium oligotrophicum S58]
MEAHEIFLDLPIKRSHGDLIAYFADALTSRLPRDVVPIRFVVTETTGECYRCEVGVISGGPAGLIDDRLGIFRFRDRKIHGGDGFNVVYMVPTGIGAEIGGHVGDAGPAARLLATTCDRLITHPNVVNAADLNELPENGVYVEGSVICRLLMGTIGLQPVRSNRILVVIGEHKVEKITNYSINATNAARASCGYQCTELLRLDPPFDMKAYFTSSGRAAGRVEHLERLLDLLAARRGQFDAVALNTIIEYPEDDIIAYYNGPDDSVNPWGGIEAILTHAVTHALNVPSAHSPQLNEYKSIPVGVGHPVMAAELISAAYLQCILKGLSRSPRLIVDPEAMLNRNVLTAADVSCVVMPDRCLGLPTLAALQQEIPVIAVRDSTNRARTDLSMLPWAPGKLLYAENYLEACGLLSALRSGVAVESLRRPLHRLETPIIRPSWDMEPAQARLSAAG